MRLPVLILLLACAAPLAGYADETRETLFRTAEAARSGAAEARAAKLAPQSFAAGEAALQRARNDYERGRALDRIRREIDAANEAYATARSSALRAERALSETLGAREDALVSAADQLYPTPWQAAESLLNAAAVALERGDEARATSRTTEATQAYRDVELMAIEGRLLSRARAEIAQAQANRIDRHAPLTLARARDLLAEAESVLARDRRAVQRAAGLAARAEATARQADYLATAVQAARSRDGSIEEALLAATVPLRAVAREAGVPEAETGAPEALGEALQQHLRALDAQLQQTDAALTAANQRILAMDEELRELDQQLGGVARERSELIMALQAQEEVRAQFTRLEDLFARDEAIVLREGDRIIIRLVGLNFPTNAATVRREDRPLLAKLGEAANIFPQARFTIEGHTDSRGSAQLNLRLSQERADAVLEHLQQEQGIPAARLRAIGLGPSRPIASNDTSEGQARNRRIDVTFVAATPP